MKDRVPVYPNKYAVYDENHSFIRYEYHERADAPASGDEGDALNKANLLPDATCTALGIATSSVPKDALNALATLASSKATIATGSYVGTDAFGSASPNSLAIPSGAKSLTFTGRQKNTNAQITTGPILGAPYTVTLTLAMFNASYIVINNSTLRFKIDSGVIYWYDTSNATNQWNAADYTYYYKFEI